MTTYADKITDLEKQIAVLKKRREEELKESAELVQYHIYDMFDSANPDMVFTDKRGRI